MKLENIAFFTSLGFVLFNTNLNMLIYQEREQNIMIVNMYIDDFLLTSKY